MKRTARAPSPWTVVLMTVSLGVAINLATGVVDVHWRWWPVASGTALLVLTLASVRVEVLNRRASTRERTDERVWHQVPPRLQMFAARRAELSALAALLSRKYRQGVRVVAVHGMGGVGKSSLVAEYAHRHWDTFGLVWWIAANDRASVVASLAELAGELGRESVDPEQAAAAALRLLAAKPRRWLLVFDDVPAPEQIENLLPTAGCGAVVVTSRNPQWQHIAQTLEVDLLTMAEAESLLRERTNQVGPGITALADRLGRLPLALDAAAQYCTTTRTPVETLAQRLTAALPPPLRGTVDLVCERSLRHLATTHPEAVDLLRLLACLAPGESPRELVSVAPAPLPGTLRQAVATDPALGDLLYALRSVGLVQLDAHGDPWIHELVQDAVRADTARLDGAADRQWLLAATHLLATATTVDDGHTFTRWPWLARLPRHAQAVLRRCDELCLDEPAVATLRLNLSMYLFDLGQRAFARTLREQAVASRRRLLEADDPGLAEALDALSRCLRLSGELSTAERLSREAHEIARRRLGLNHPLTLRVQNGLAGVLFRQGNVAASRKLRDEVVARARTVLGEHDPLYWMLVNDLAAVVRSQGEIGRTLELRRSAYQAMLRLLGEEHPRTQTIKNDLAFTLWDHGNLAGARRLMEDTYARRSRILGPDNVTTLVSLSNLALILRDQGEHDEAMRMDLEVLDARLRLLGHDDLTTLISISHLAQAYALAGDYANAERNYTDVYRTRIRILGPDANATLQATTDLANFLTGVGQYDRAVELHRRTLQTRLDRRGPRDRGVATSRHGLGLALLGVGDLEGARESLEQALAVRVELLGEAHQHTRATRDLLATVLDRLNGQNPDQLAGPDR